jgi:hypothetical protein
VFSVGIEELLTVGMGLYGLQLTVRTVQTVGGRGGGGEQKDKSKKCRAPCGLGVFCVQCAFRGKFFDRGYGYYVDCMACVSAKIHG